MAQPGADQSAFGYYQSIAPMLNDLMCYFTFIGRWKELTPPQVVEPKRAIDREFYCALPLFSEESGRAYDAFMAACFSTFGAWGDDAKLRTGYVHRKQASPTWQASWESMFTYAEQQGVTPSELRHFRHAYDGVLRALAHDIELLEPRDRSAPTAISANAH